MSPENDQTRWIGIRPVNPPENIPVTESTPLTSIEVEPTAGSADFPVAEQFPLTQLEVEPLPGTANFPTTTRKLAPAIGDLQAPKQLTRVFDQKLNVGAPNYQHDAYIVPAGVMFQLQFLDAYCAQATPTNCDFVLRKGVVDYTWLFNVYGLAWSHNTSITPILYNENEIIRVSWTGTLAGTDVYAMLFGYQIPIY